ncbi:CPBP family intramembrane glutamic endopeptidase [Muriicola sp. SD30]|uniref:CPBP family intramembrane glutamic endopeptidase n=1 Tax=Muriicola sp. SD30 TaxID=3240936 RepID=UPI00350EF8A7
MKELFKFKPIISFILLTFIITFSFWFLPVMIAIPKDLEFAFILIGSCGPLIAAYVITVINSDEKFTIKSKPIFLAVFIAATILLFLRIYFAGKGLSDLNGEVNGKIPTLNEISVLGYLMLTIPLLILSINASNATNKKLNENYLTSFIYNNSKLKWYLIGIFTFITLSLLSYFIGSFVGINVTDFIINPKLIWFIGFFSAILLYGGSEEFGWRGFLQKELQKKHNPLITSTIIIVLWRFWHLPLHYNGYHSNGGFVDVLPGFIWTIPLTFIATWLYNKSSYSILAVILLHAMFNNVDKAFGSSKMIFVVSIWLFAVFCIINDKMWKKKPYHLIYEKNKNGKKPAANNV